MQESDLWKAVESIISDCEVKSDEKIINDGQNASLLLMMQDLLETKDIEIKARFTGDSARALHAALLISKLIWNVDEEKLITRIFSTGIEELLNQFDVEMTFDSTNHILKPIIRQILQQLRNH
jgi:hypothetical protein